MRACARVALVLVAVSASIGLAACAAVGQIALPALWGGSAGKPFGGRCQREKVPAAGASGQRVRNCDGAG